MQRHCLKLFWIVKTSSHCGSVKKKLQKLSFWAAKWSCTVEDDRNPGWLHKSSSCEQNFAEVRIPPEKSTGLRRGVQC